MSSTRPLAVLGSLLVLIGAPSASPAQEAGAVDVVEISGLLDQTLIRFVRDTIETQARAGSQLVILQLDSAGAVSGEVNELLDLVADPPLPVAVWVGPAPAEAFGGAAQLLAVASIRAAAPGAQIGYLSPVVAGQPSAEPVPGPAELAADVNAVQDRIPGLVDVVEPALAQLVAALNGKEVLVRGEPVVLSTIEQATTPDGEVIVHPVQTRFFEPGLGTRALRIGLSPDAAFFFTAMGLAVMVFEFYALGPGIAAAVGLVSLLAGSYGLVAMPLNWWGLALMLAGIALLTAQFQRGRAVGWGTAAGALLLFVGGLTLTAAAPQFGPTWWVALLVTLVVVLFYVMALPTVARARLSTRTIGREYLIGQPGVATEDFVDGEGMAEVDGARWRASSHREADLRRGDPLVVTDIHGVYLGVEPTDDRSAKRFP